MFKLKVTTFLRCLLITDLILLLLLSWQTLFHTQPGNHSQLPVFLLLGLSEKPEIQSVLFGLFLSLYLVTIFGNRLVILAIITDSHLHTPMYLFLSNLSLSDICFTSTTIPKMLLNLQTQSKAITYTGCITQMYFFSFWTFGQLTPDHDGL